jgi:predicted flavoprotein YhiN
MDLQNGDGQIETKNIKLINTPITEKVTSCLHSNGEDYWVITHTSGNTNFYSYLITQSGLSGPVVTSIGSTHNTVEGI